MPRPAAIFDLDGTLLGGASAELRLLRRALRSGIVGWRGVGSGGLHALAARWRGDLETLAASKAHWRGAATDALEALAVDCVDTDILPHLRPGVLAALEAHRARGACIVLLTGTLDCIAAPLARALRADWCVATHLERRSGRCTGRILPPHPHGAGKVEALEALAASAGIDLAASHAYADRGSDIPHLLRVGFAHAVSPDRALRRLAAARGWPILEDPGGDRSARAR